MQPGLDALAGRRFDILVLGGGIVGAACAREAARRGHRVALAEARDFGAGTTGASTRLAHGGLRYLQRLDLRQVREGLRGRAWLLRAAPHLVRPLPFLLPLRAGERAFRASLRAGLAAYDALGPGGLPRHRFLDREAALAAEPALRPEGLRGAARFHDAQIASVERLNLEFALDAAAQGAAVANHAPAVALERSADGWRATLRGPGGEREVRARVVLNCTGPWAERVAGLAGVRRPMLRTTRGSHVALAGLLRHGLVLRAPDRRTFFAVPWDEVTLVGTTDIDEPRDPSDVLPTRDEVAQLLREAGAFAALPWQRAYTTAGVRALVRVEGVPTGAVPRAHRVVDHAPDDAPGLLSVIGGKITTAARVARDAVDEAGRALGDRRPCATGGVLPGAAAAGKGPGALLGARAPDARGLVCARHATRGMVRLAVEEEWCATLTDLMFRRSLAGHAPDLGAHCAAAMAAAMGERLGWGPGEREAQMRDYEAEVARRRAGL